MTDSPFFVTRFTGALINSGRSLSVSGGVTVSREGDVKLEFDDVQLDNETFWIHECWQDTAFNLTATDQDNRVLSSRSVYLSSVGTKSNAEGQWTTLAGMADWLESNEIHFELSNVAADITAAYFVVGLRGFQVQSRSTHAGTLLLHGSSDVRNFDEISGRVDVRAEQSSLNLRDWIPLADAVATDALDIVSLAEGRLIRWSVRRLVRHGKVLATEFRGPSRTGTPRRGFHHWLDLQPVVELSANYTPALKARTGIHVALEWSLMNPPYLELDFVACMTALEHLTDVFEEGNVKQAPPGRAFFRQEIAPRVQSAVEAAAALAASPEDMAAIEKSRRKINDLNRTSLQDSIERMLLAYGVPMRGLESALSALIKLRNDIVHRGIARDKQEAVLQEQVDVVRELLIRIFLKLLNYRGNYDSYLTGKEQGISFAAL